jgi:hypothetical protein
MRAGINHLRFETLAELANVIPFPAATDAKTTPLGEPVVNGASDPKKKGRSQSPKLAKTAALLPVGETGFEPATPWSRTKCSTRLSHSPDRHALTRGAHRTWRQGAEYLPERSHGVKRSPQVPIRTS